MLYLAATFGCKVTGVDRAEGFRPFNAWVAYHYHFNLRERSQISGMLLADPPRTQEGHGNSIVFHSRLGLFRLRLFARFHPAVQRLVIVGVDLNDVAKGIFAVAKPVFVCRGVVPPDF